MVFCQPTVLALQLAYVIVLSNARADVSPLNKVSRPQAGVKDRELDGVFGRMLLDVGSSPRGGARSLIVAASDLLVRYNYQLEEEARIEDPPSQELFVGCVRRGISKDYCQNHYRVLLTGDYHGQRALLACGTNAYSPACMWRSLIDFSVLEKFSNIVSKKMCPQDPRYQNVASLGGGALFSGTDPDVNIDDDVAVMKLLKEPFLRTMEGNEFLNSPTFVAAFPVDDFMYIVFRELGKGDDKDKAFAHVARICLYDKPPSKFVFQDKFSNFVKARIMCVVPGGESRSFRYDEIVDVFDHRGSVIPGQDDTRLMYAIFTTPPNSPLGSVLCVYSYDQTTREKSNLRTVFEGNFLYKSRNDEWKTGRPSRPYECVEGGEARDADTAHRYYRMQNAVQPMTKSPLLKKSVRFTALAVDRVHVYTPSDRNLVHISYDVIFIGTGDGRVLKVVYLKEGTEGLVVEEIEVLGGTGGQNEACAREGNKKFTMKLDGNKGVLFLAVENENLLMSVPVQRCHRYTTCIPCLAAQDPYCGWCKAEKRCTTQKSCFGMWEQSVQDGSVHVCEFAGYKAPRITSFPLQHRYYKEQFDDIEFRCQATGVPMPTVRWTRNGEILTTSRWDGVVVKNGFAESRLSIVRLDIHNSGTYVCVARNKIGKADSMTDVLVFVKPKIAHPPVEVRVISGHAAAFHCGTTGIPLPVITWVFRASDGEVFKSPKRLKKMSDRRLELKNGSLVILSVTTADNGLYRCRAFNEYGTANSSWMRLTVEVPPSLKQLDKNKTTIHLQPEIKTPLHLNCPVIVLKNYTTPNISWFHNGFPLNLTDDEHAILRITPDKDVAQISQGSHPDTQAQMPYRYFYYIQYKNGSLSIPLLGDVSGAWECRASNRLGLAVLNPSYLIVNDQSPGQEPEPHVDFKFEKKPEDLKVTEGHSAKFHCSVSSELKPVYHWFRVKEKKRVRIKQDNEHYYFVKNGLLIFDVKKKDKGEYLCEVKSKKNSTLKPLEAHAKLAVRSVLKYGGASNTSPLPRANVKSRLMCTMVSVESRNDSKIRRFAAVEVHLPVERLDEDREFNCVSHKGTGMGDLTAQMDITPYPYLLEMPPPIMSVWKPTYPASLYCRAKCLSNRRYKIVWTFDFSAEIKSDWKNYRIKNNYRDCESRLTVLKVSSLQGFYTCWFRDQNGGGALSSLPARLNHWDPRFYEGPKNRVEYFAVRHSEITVVCPLLARVYPDYDIRGHRIWHSNGTVVSENDRSLLYQRADGSLRVRSVDERIYKAKIRCIWKGKVVQIRFTEYTGFKDKFPYKNPETRYVKNGGYDWTWQYYHIST